MSLLTNSSIMTDYNYNFKKREPGETNTQAEIRREKRNKFQELTPNAYSLGGGNVGGQCEDCGTPLGYWLNYRKCDKCIGIKSDAVQNTGIS